MKKLKIIACKVMMRELYYLAYKCENIVDILFLRQGLHDEPKKLTESLQRAIDQIESEPEPYDAICLGYGLCSNGIVGITSQRTPIIVPRAHDCISLLLGSRQKYDELFKKYNGIYWYSPGWLEHNRKGMPGPDRLDILRRKYTEQYDDYTAEALLETELEWMRRYGYAIFVDWEYLDNEEYREYTKKCAQFLDWKYICQPGSPALLERMICGEWDDKDFLIVPPGKQLRPSFDDLIIKL
ncbi:MAG: DUF1638 domain-containing protein [Candidatus Heteroscillospira sp.]